MGGTNQPGSFALLEELTGVSERKLASLEQRSEEEQDVTMQMADIQEKFD